LNLPVCCLLLLALASASAAASARPEALLVFDPQQPLSVLDAEGIRAALQEQRIPYVEHERSAQAPLSASLLADHPALLLAHVVLGPAEIAATDSWVRAGGGLLASGAAGQGLEPLLGLGPLAAMNRNASTELRFVGPHPVATGSFWSGPISQNPPSPIEELPGIQQLFYLDPVWPAYTASLAGADVLARWRRAESPWFSSDGSPAAFAHQPGQGRTVYLGALPGAYMDPDWRYPRSWRTVISEALAWVNTRGTLVELGYWPQGARAAYAFTADAERPQMATVVPQLLTMFQQLGLQRFGTFFIVAQAGGDPGTQGAIQNPGLVAQILDGGSELGGHGDVHARFAGLGLAEQTQRLQAMRGLIEPLMGARAPLLGFRGPYLAVDRNTYRAAAAAGLAYDSSDQDVWSEWSLPYFNDELWQLPPTSMMDYRLLVNSNLSPAEWELITRDKQAFIESRRGLFNWLTHPWVIADSLPRVRSMLSDAAARDDLWLRRLDDILLWWMQREALSVEVIESDDFRLRLRVSNADGRAIEGASIWLRLPQAEFPWRSRVDGIDVERLPRPHGVGAEQTPYEVVVIPQIDAQSSVLVELDIARPDPLFSDGFEG